MSEKECAWCGEPIKDERRSKEDRDFYPYGKLCLYYCDDKCQANYLEDKKKHGLGIYYITVRGAE